MKASAHESQDGPKAGAPLVVVVVVVVLQGCFLLVSSGIHRDIPEGARAQAAGKLEADELVVAAWDGSMAQDGGLLVILSDHRILKKAGGGWSSVDLRDVQTIVVNEDEGSVDVITGGTGLSLPLRSSEERRTFAHLIQSEVQKRKKLAHEEHEPPTLVVPPEAEVGPMVPAPP